MLSKNFAIAASLALTLTQTTPLVAWGQVGPGTAQGGAGQPQGATPDSKNLTATPAKFSPPPEWNAAAGLKGQIDALGPTSTSKQIADVARQANRVGDKITSANLYRRALKVADDAHDTFQSAICLDNLDFVLPDGQERVDAWARLSSLVEKNPSLASVGLRVFARKADDLYWRGRIADSENYLQKARKLTFKLDNKSDLQGDLQSMQVVINLLTKLGKYSEAMLECKRSLDICESKHMHVISYGLIMRVKGQCLYAQEKYDQAEKCYQEALLKLETENCTANYLYGAILADRCLVRLRNNDLDLARVDFDRAQPILNSATNIGEVDVRSRLAIAIEPLIRFGKLSEVMQVAGKLYAERKANYAADSIMVAEAELLHAWALAANRQKAEALTFADQAIYILSTKLTPEDDHQGRVQWQMAEIDNLCGRKEAAKDYYDKAALIFRARAGINSQLYKDCQTKIAGLANKVPYFVAALPPGQQDTRSVLPVTQPVLVKQNTSPDALFSNLANGAAAAARYNQSRSSSKVTDKWALVVGISKFQESKLNLRYPAKDASDLYRVLIDKLNFAPDHVALLTNQYATRENILSMLGDTWLPHVAGPDDLVLIYLSTHGSPSELDLAGINYLLAYNTDPHALYATGIPLQDLVAMVKKRVHSKRVIIMLDACHSGSAEVDAKGMSVARQVDAQMIVQGTGQMVICSSSPSELSWESKQYPNGVFSRQLIDSLVKTGGMQPFTSIFSTLSSATSDEVRRDRGVTQTPVLRSAWSGEDLYLGAKPSNPQPGLGINILLSDLTIGESGKAVAGGQTNPTTNPSTHASTHASTRATSQAGRSGARGR